MLVDNTGVDLSFFFSLPVVPVFLLLAFAFLFWGGNGVLGLQFGRFGEGRWEFQFESPEADLSDEGCEVEDGVVNAVLLGL